jgi:hypothetical protein
MNESSYEKHDHPKLEVTKDQPACRVIHVEIPEYSSLCGRFRSYAVSADGVFKPDVLECSTELRSPRGRSVQADMWVRDSISYISHEFGRSSTVHDSMIA